jgi:hypothetical protein
MLSAEPMKTITLDLPTFAFIVATRAGLAAGAALLLGHKLPGERRRLVGAALVAVGALTTIPAVLSVRRGIRQRRRRAQSGVNYDPRLVGATRYPRKGDDEIG